MRGLVSEEPDFWFDGIFLSTGCLLWISNGSGGGFPNPCGLAVQTTVMFLRAMVPLLSGFSCHYSQGRSRMVYGQLNRLYCRISLLKERWNFATILVLAAETRFQRNMQTQSLLFMVLSSEFVCRHFIRLGMESCYYNPRFAPKSAMYYPRLQVTAMRMGIDTPFENSTNAKLIK